MWIQKFGNMKAKKKQSIVETESIAQQISALNNRIAELEGMLVQKQILIDFKDKMIELMELEYRYNSKKTQPNAPTNSEE